MRALRQLLPASLVAVLALAALTACGGGDPDATVAEAPAESPSAFDAATAVLSDEPFCEKVDPTLVAGALGAAADTVALVAERVVDAERRQGADHRVRRSRVNGCTFGSGGSTLVVGVQPADAEAAVRTRIERFRRGGCTLADDPWFGSPGVVADCERSHGRRSVAVVGVIGGGGFFCTSTIATGAVHHDATVEVCRDTLETVGVPG